MTEKEFDAAFGLHNHLLKLKTTAEQIKEILKGLENNDHKHHIDIIYVYELSSVIQINISDIMRNEIKEAFEKVLYRIKDKISEAEIQFRKL